MRKRRSSSAIGSAGLEPSGSSTERGYKPKGSFSKSHSDRRSILPFVPAKAGTQLFSTCGPWVPACAGTNGAQALNRLIVLADFLMSAQHGVDRLEHVAHVHFRDRALDHHARADFPIRS